VNIFRIVASAIALAMLAASAEAATFSIRSTDGTGEGLNDATAFTPVGGNNATTLGQARMNVLQEAARIWGTLLQSNVVIQIDAAFDPQTCSQSSGTLGSAGPRAIYRNFGGGVSPDTYYVAALADALAGTNLASNPANADIGATFNSSVDSDGTCLAGRKFYYGFDHNRGTKIDLLLVVLHEFGHGLGFTSGVDLSTGKGYTGNDGIERFDSFTNQLFDEQFNAAWPDLTDAQRVQSATHTDLLAWKGPNVNAQIGRFSQGFTANARIKMYAPATVSSGSSVSHFDTSVSPSVLMEPNLPGSITTSSTDITVCALQDLGWTVTVCPHYQANRPPTANNQSVTTAEDTSITITLTGSDPDNDPLIFSIATPPTKGTLSAIAATVPHTVTYTPNTNANGSDSFVFTVSDATTSSSATVTISITPVNDAPTAADESVVATSGQGTSITLSGSDVDGDTLSYQIVTNPAHGTLTGSGPNLTYTSTSGYIGADSFTYRVSDGTLNSPAATVTLNVQNPPQVGAASSGGGGGGGATTIEWLATFLLFALARRYARLVT
jgi:hypothetical protein